jgi:hypothetical protein
MKPFCIREPSLASRAMLCSLSIRMWSARKHDREASDEIAQRHGAQPDAGRYHKALLPKAAGNSRFFAPPWTVRSKAPLCRKSARNPCAINRIQIHGRADFMLSKGSPCGCQCSE